MKRNRIIRDQKGIALIMTLMAVSFMAAVTVYLLSTINWQMQASTNLRDGVALDAVNRSCLNLARAALWADQQGGGQFDTLQDGWHTLDPEKLHALLGRERIEVLVTDLSGLLQVNALVSTLKQPNDKTKQENLQKELWIRFLTSGRFGDIDLDRAGDLVDSIRDWIDDDDNVENGAESGYYLSQSPPYQPRNGPLLYPEELLLIKGMTPELFYGKEGVPGIKDFITVFGREGKININTAPPEVLLALAENMDTEMVQDMVEFRENEDNLSALGSSGWYHNAGVPGYVAISPELLSVRSSYFRILSTSRDAGGGRTGAAVLERLDNGGQNLLSWEVR